MCNKMFLVQSVEKWLFMNKLSFQRQSALSLLVACPSLFSRSIQSSN